MTSNGHGANGATDPTVAAHAARVDVDAANESMNRLQSIFRDIAATAEESFRNRCPYKNAQSRCTAKFGCGYQHFTQDPTALPVCTGSDKLDYRSAWQVPAGTE